MAKVSRWYYWTIRAIAAVTVIGCFVCLTAKTAAPDGELTVTSRLWGPAPFLSEPKPGERLIQPNHSAVSDGLFAVRDTPIYFDLKPLAGFDQVIQTVRYRNDGGLSLELGALASSIDEQYDMRPAESRLLDTLPWHRLTSGRLMLLQREQKYASLDDFLAKPPPPSQVAVWGTTPALPYRLTGYQAADEPWETEVSLRGRHRFYVYVKDETLNLVFSVQDMNRQLGADPVIVSVYPLSGGQPLARAVLDDDGNSADDQDASGLRTVAVTADGLAEGAYQVEFTASADVFIRRLKSAQSKLVLAERLYFGDYVGYSDTIPVAKAWTDGQRLTARTWHDEARQEMTAAGKPLSLSETGAAAVLQLPTGRQLAAISAPKRDVLLETDGVFSLTPESWFDPLPLPVDWHLTADQLAARQIDFVLADYASPQLNDGLKTVSVQYRTDQLARTEQGAWRFLVDVPGVDYAADSLSIESVSFSLRRQPFTWSELPDRLFRLLAGREIEERLVLPNGQSFEESLE